MTVKTIQATHNAAQVATDTDWFSSDIVAGDLPSSKHTLQMMVTVGNVVNVQLKNNSVTKVLNLNGGTALTANAGYQFDLILRPGDTYNIQHSTASASPYCLITESDNTDI